MMDQVRSFAGGEGKGTEIGMNEIVFVYLSVPLVDLLRI